MNEQPNARITKIVAKMIQAIHGRPRQTLGKLTAADAESAIDELDAIDRKNEMKRSLDAKALERMPAADDLRKGQLSSGNVDEECAKYTRSPTAFCCTVLRRRATIRSVALSPKAQCPRRCKRSSSQGSIRRSKCRPRFQLKSVTFSTTGQS
jgi:hypothetical protein